MADSKTKKRCSFCGRSENEVGFLITGMNGYICDSCATPVSYTHLVDEADVILFVVDVMNGVTDLDMQVAAILRRANSPVIMAVSYTHLLHLFLSCVRLRARV